MCSQKPHALDDLCMDRLHGSARKWPYKFQCKINMPCMWPRADTNSAVEHCCHSYVLLVCACVRDKRLSCVKQTVCCLYSGSLLWSQNAAPVFNSWSPLTTKNDKNHPFSTSWLSPFYTMCITPVWKKGHLLECKIIKKGKNRNKP